MSYKMSSEQLRDEEEALRNQIRELNAEQRKHYYRLEGQRIKDRIPTLRSIGFFWPAYIIFI